jgi:ABC-type multidrug transport system ATPase subunit
VKENFRNCSVVAIAHRLDTIADYDKILVMEKGRLVESGTPRELVKLKGRFWEMIYKDNNIYCTFPWKFITQEYHLIFLRCCLQFLSEILQLFPRWA